MSSRLVGNAAVINDLTVGGFGRDCVVVWNNDRLDKEYVMYAGCFGAVCLYW